MSYETLLEEVRNGRRKVLRVSYHCERRTGAAEAEVIFANGDTFVVTADQGDKLFAASRHTRDLSVEQELVKFLGFEDFRS
jgi:hypothetical protein